MTTAAPGSNPSVGPIATPPGASPGSLNTTTGIGTNPIRPPGSEASGGRAAGAVGAAGASRSGTGTAAGAGQGAASGAAGAGVRQPIDERLERRNREINSTVMRSICRGC